MTNEIKLAPCPFCGGEGEFELIDDDRTVVVECIDCGASGARSCISLERSAKQEAAGAWNRRIGGEV